MVIRESQKLICKPLTQISSSAGTGRRGQNSPSVLMEKVTFFFNVGVCILHRSPSKFNGRGHSDTSVGSALALLSRASCGGTRSSREFPDTAESQQREEGKGSEKGHPSPISTSSLVPGPYLAGGVCSQCFAEGQNSQSPDCRSCYSPGGQSEFLLPTEDVEKREGVLVTN